VPVFDEDRIKRIVALSAQKEIDGSKEWTPDAILERLDAAIIGNLRYKQTLAMCLADYIGKSGLRNHLLIAGPSGTGKTYLLEQCLPMFGIPFLVVDASSLVPAGYKGLTLQEAFGEFFRLNPQASRKAILVLDEFDKIS
jgi:ATP-dependent Clp protease ATP-binding subunit ClpX